jgi:hypothetical protein
MFAAARSMMFLDSVQKQRAIGIATEIGDHIKGRKLEVSSPANLV